MKSHVEDELTEYMLNELHKLHESIEKALCVVDKEEDYE